MTLSRISKATIKFEDDMVEATQHGHIYKKIVLAIIEWAQENEDTEMLNELEQIVADSFEGEGIGGH